MHCKAFAPREKKDTRENNTFEYFVYFTHQLMIGQFSISIPFENVRKQKA